MAQNHNTPFAAIILAAGSSSRLGAPKQLLLFKDKSLIRHAVDEAKAAGAAMVMVVSGALDLGELEQDAIILNNESWQEGMASSIRKGIAHLQGLTEMEGAIVMVCDQPYADREVLMRLVDAHKASNKPVIASEYGGRAGTPAFFHRSFFPELMQLQGDVGAKHLIAAHKEHAVFVGFPEGITDIDTLSDYERILKEIKKA